MYVCEKKIPVKNTVRKNIRRNDGQVKENRGSRYYLDDTRRDVKLPSTNVVQNVLFADIPLDEQGKFNYKEIKETQGFKTLMTEGIGFKTVEKAKEDFPRLSDYLSGKAVQLDDVLNEIYEKGKIAMGEFTEKVGDICREKMIPLANIEGIWGNSID